MRVGNGTATSTLTYLLGDHLGSTSLTFKADTYATTTQLYKPWGGRKRRFRVRSQSGTLPTQYTYTGQYSHTADFGLMFYVARWYDPVLGRFAQADTLVPGAGHPMAWDRYAGMMNNPVKYTDPSGHSADCGISDDYCDAGKIEHPKDLIYRKNEMLAKLVGAGKISDLEAFALLVEYAAFLTPDCVDCFLENLGSVITGMSDGNSAYYEMMHRLDPEGYPYDEYYLGATKLQQSGYAIEFQDRDPERTGANQARHFLFYIQVGFESGELLGTFVNAAHECCIPIGTTAGKSYQDYALGAEGLQLGAMLAAGTVSPNDVGNYIRNALSPGSWNAQRWDGKPMPLNESHFYFP